MIQNRIFYTIKPLIPRRLQIFIRRLIAAVKREKYAHIWPINPAAAKPPEEWQGWPDGKKFALVLRHDVETQKGHDNCYQLIELEKRLGFRSSYYFVPERYKVSSKLREDLIFMGFDVGVHGLKHDGKLFSSRRIFEKRALRINHYLKEWGVEGFTAPSTLQNFDWMPDLNIKHSGSTFDADPFEPIPDGVGTIFPFKVKGNATQNSFIELPYTLPQDFTLFVVLREKDSGIWKRKLDWIVKKGGMALLNSHPDYMNFDGRKLGLEEYPVKYYVEFLDYIKDKYEGQYWQALPDQIALFWKENYRHHSSASLMINGDSCG